jgi:type IV pilus assembly protein PilA
MIAVAIIAILVAIGIPQYQNYVARAQATEGINLASGIKTALAEFYNINGTFPAGTADANVELGVESASTIVGKYIDGVVVSNDGLGMITASFGSGTHVGKYVRLRAVVADGSISFECDSDIEESYRLSECGGPTDSTELTEAFRQTHNLVFDHHSSGWRSGKPKPPPSPTNPSAECTANLANGYPCTWRWLTRLRQAAFYDEAADWHFAHELPGGSGGTWEDKVNDLRARRDTALLRGRTGTAVRPVEPLAAEYEALVLNETDP